ncbi:hypothetical protein [Burkholderia lata]|uniref:hypothetical protein n=1 Tax=Burkholderia lata (strain ATCC 17760 / DSM 23089 / LMG 22485 / NCIMB 9086 / R18194 / 383) TaxID=482957 RepID=UPI0020C71806|nr:hypothetical protein [Burkholderia lata]
MGPPSSLGHKHERNIDAIVPQTNSISARAEIGFGLPHDMLTPEGAKRYIATQWRNVETNGRFDQAHIDALAATLSERVLSHPAGETRSADGGQTMAASAIMISDALAQATGGDPARAKVALEALLDSTPHADPAVRADVLALQIALGATATGMEALLTIAPHVLPQHRPNDHSPVAEIRHEAFRHALRAADQLLQNWPANAPAPTSLDELAAIADHALPMAERVRTNSNRIAAAPDAPERAPAWLADSRNTLAIKALQAAIVLRADPTANCPPHQAAAYMAWRNGFDREGPGTDLAKTQQRFFKLFTYAERAAKTGMAARAASGFFGKQKSPLSALQNFGTGGVMLGRPDDEFAHFTDAIAPVKARLIMQLKDPAASHEEKARSAVRIAALDQWEQRTGSKGLRSKFKFSSSDLKSIEARTRALLPNRPAVDPEGNIVGDDETRRTRDTEAVRSAIKALAKMTPEQLRIWATEAWQASEEDVPEAVTQKFDTLERRLSGADVRPKPGDTDKQFDAIDTLVQQLPDTYDIRFSSGGTFGLASVPSESLAAFSKHLNIPSASILPDMGYIHGRHAVIDVGSNSHFGHIFIGSDSRRSIYGGVGGFAGWGLDKKSHFSAGISGSLRQGYDWGGPRGVTIRTRRSDNEQPESPDAWRTMMLNVLHTARHAGPNDGAPRNAVEMWGGIVQRFWKDPGFSVNWTESRNKTSATTGSISATVRGGTPKTKWGPSIGASLRKITKAVNRQKDETGNHSVNVATNNSGRAVSVSATLVEGLPGAPMPHHSGHLAALSFPSQPYVGFGTTLLTTNTNAALRIGRDSDRTIASHSFKDTEFGTFKEFKQYIDTYRSEWLASLGGGDAASKKLDKWVAQVKEGADAGNLIMGERVRMTDQTAQNLDFLLHRKQRLDRLSKPTPAQARELARIDANIRQVLANENSWRRKSLYVIESLGAQRTVGLSFLVNAQSTQSVSGAREMAGLSAD